jgi:hypothetical protein
METMMSKQISKKVIAAYNHGYTYFATYARPGHIEDLTKEAQFYYTEERLVRAFQDGWFVALNEHNSGKLIAARKVTQ